MMSVLFSFLILLIWTLFFFLMSMAKGLSILSFQRIFLVSLIFSTVVLVSIYFCFYLCHRFWSLFFCLFSFVSRYFFIFSLSSVIYCLFSSTLLILHVFMFFVVFFLMVDVYSHSIVVRSNLGFSHCRQILYCLSHQGSPDKILF